MTFDIRFMLIELCFQNVIKMTIWHLILKSYWKWHLRLTHLAEVFKTQFEVNFHNHQKFEVNFNFNCNYFWNSNFEPISFSKPVLGSIPCKCRFRFRFQFLYLLPILFPTSQGTNHDPNLISVWLLSQNKSYFLFLKL